MDVRLAYWTFRAPEANHTMPNKASTWKGLNRSLPGIADSRIRFAAWVLLAVTLLTLPRLLTDRYRSAIPEPGPRLPLGEFPLIITDAMGRQVRMPARPMRLVSMAPSVTEALFVLGAGDRLVGRTRFCLYPAEALNVRAVGGLNDPTLELLITFKPDLVLATLLTPHEVVAQMESLKLKVAVLAFSGIVGSWQDMWSIARLIDASPDQAESLLSQERRLDKVRHLAREIAWSDRPRTLLLFGRQGYFSCGTGSFAGELIELAGGNNLAALTGASWPQLARESILKWDPQVIVIALYQGKTSMQTLEQEVMQNWQADPLWMELSAVRHNRIHVIGDTWMTVPGPRMAESAEWLAARLHPGRFQSKQLAQ